MDKQPYRLPILGGIIAFLLIAMAFLYIQQQRLQRTLTEFAAQRSGSTGGEAATPSPGPVPQGPLYGDIGLRGEWRDPSSYALTEWNAEDRIIGVEIFSLTSLEDLEGSLLFQIAAEENAALPKPYVLGAVPDGFLLIAGTPLSDLPSGRYRYEVTALQEGSNVKVLSYLEVG